jgi:hypothetical protein
MVHQGSLQQVPFGKQGGKSVVVIKIHNRNKKRPVVYELYLQ